MLQYFRVNGCQKEVHIYTHQTPLKVIWRPFYFLSYQTHIWHTLCNATELVGGGTAFNILNNCIIIHRKQAALGRKRKAGYNRLHKPFTHTVWKLATHSSAVHSQVMKLKYQLFSRSIAHLIHVCKAKGVAAGRLV